MNKGENKGRGLLRRLPLPSPPEQRYPSTSTARTRRRTLHLPPTLLTTQPALATPETTRRLDPLSPSTLSPSTQGERRSSAAPSSAPALASLLGGWLGFPLPPPSPSLLFFRPAVVPVGR